MTWDSGPMETPPDTWMEVLYFVADSNYSFGPTYLQVMAPPNDAVEHNLDDDFQCVCMVKHKEVIGVHGDDCMCLIVQIRHNALDGRMAMPPPPPV